MANPHKGETRFEVGGASYTLVLPVGALIEVEDLLDTELSDAIVKLSRMRIGVMRVFLWAALRTHHRGLSLDDATAILNQAGIVATGKAIDDTLRASQPDLIEAGENPQLASPSAAGPTSS